MTKKLSNQLKTSLKKYKETYRLLEEYDKKSAKEPKILAESGRLRGAISKLQKPPGSRGTYPSI